MESNTSGIEVTVNAPEMSIATNRAQTEILTPDALRFVGFLCHKFEDRRQALLATREVRALSYDAGNLPHFLTTISPAPPPSTTGSNDDNTNDNWQCAPIPTDLQDRRVEITGPVDRKMVINGLNSGANVYMADFEDSTSPTWANLITGQKNLRDAVRGTITYTHPQTGKRYTLNDDKDDGNDGRTTKRAVLFVRPRGWHLPESHLLINNRSASASLFDFGLYLYHNVHALLRNGSGPYLYLPKIESHLEARLWNDVFLTSQSYLGLPRGTIRATALLETITAAFEMEEILYELREHSLGLNCGRWDYLFSFIKKFKYHGDKVAPDRMYLTMTAPMMKAYVRRLIQICHRRGTFAMGGMSAAIPIRDDTKANDLVMAKIREDKLREVLAGHDGTWVAHPALVSVARKVFDEYMPTPNQIRIGRTDTSGSEVTETELLELPRVPRGEKAITSEGLRKGVAIVLAYTEAWLRGVGCIPLNHHMEDAATAEISRVQIWQWRVHGIRTEDDGLEVTGQRISQIVREEITHIYGGGDQRSEDKWRLAGKLVKDMLTKDKLDDFLTTVCYPHIIDYGDRGRSSSAMVRSNL